MLMRAPPGMRSTVGKPSPGPALRLTVVVTMPGAANAAVGISSKAAAINNPLIFMASSSSSSGNAVAEQVFREEVALAERYRRETCWLDGFARDSAHPARY